MFWDREMVRKRDLVVKEMAFCTSTSKVDHRSVVFSQNAFMQVQLPMAAAMRDAARNSSTCLMDI